MPFLPIFGTPSEANSASITGSGGLRVSGIGTIVAAVQESGSSGGGIGGGAIVAEGRVVLASGGLVIGGSADLSTHTGSATIVASGGVAVGGAATLLVRSGVAQRPQPEHVIPIFPIDRRRLDRDLLPQRSISIVGSGGVRVSGAASVVTIHVQVLALAGSGGISVRGGAAVETLTPFRTNRAYANDWLLREALTDRDAA